MKMKKNTKKENLYYPKQHSGFIYKLDIYLRLITISLLILILYKIVPFLLLFIVWFLNRGSLLKIVCVNIIKKQDAFLFPEWHLIYT
jgi:hypothetical protein